MRHFRKPIQRRCPQTAVNQQRIVVAHIREADHAYRLHDPGLYDREPLLGVALEVGRDVRALDEHGGDDDDHPDQREPGRARELVDVAVQGERVGDADRAERDDELPVCEPGEDGDRFEGREDGADDVRDGVAYDDSEGAHAWVACGEWLRF